MRTELCDRLGIEVPISAFTHCRDVVVAVAKAGGFGRLVSEHLDAVERLNGLSAKA
jgi:hypothetical protein